MVLVAQIGHMMKEIGAIKIKFNTLIFMKTILVICFSSLSFFVSGYGFGTNADGGLLGQTHFLGIGFEVLDYGKFIYTLTLCVNMSVISTGSIGERVDTLAYIFFSFVTAGFIFPLGLAWCWGEGWL